MKSKKNASKQDAKIDKDLKNAAKTYRKKRLEFMKEEVLLFDGFGTYR